MKKHTEIEKETEEIENVAIFPLNLDGQNKIEEDREMTTSSFVNQVSDNFEKSRHVNRQSKKLARSRHKKRRSSPAKKVGYSKYDLTSALQKDIRRGNEYEALFWAVKMEMSGKKGITTLWNRLKVIASEDIGPAYPEMPLIIETLERQYRDARKRQSSSYSLFLTNAIIILARSKKSRVTDDLLNIVYGEIQHEDKRLKIPDYALDMHTSRGSRMGRGIDHFFTEGCRLNNEAFENPYTEEAKEMLKKHGKLKPEFRKKERAKLDLNTLFPDQATIQETTWANNES